MHQMKAGPRIKSQRRCQWLWNRMKLGSDSRGNAARRVEHSTRVLFAATRRGHRRTQGHHHGLSKVRTISQSAALGGVPGGPPETALGSSAPPEPVPFAIEIPANSAACLTQPEILPLMRLPSCLRGTARADTSIRITAAASPNAYGLSVDSSIFATIAYCAS